MKTDLELKLQEMITEGLAAETIGSVDELGHYALVQGDGDEYTGNYWWIVTEDSHGFTYYTQFTTEEEAREQWAGLVRIYETYWTIDPDSL